MWLLTYKTYSSKREVEHIRKIKALDRIERKDYSILVGLSNPDTVESLTHLAIAIAKKHHATIISLHVIEVREDQKLMAGLDEAARVRPMFDKAETLAEEYDIPARSVIEVSHRISLGIVETAIEENCNFILIGRQKQPNFMDRLFSSLIDTVLQKSPSEVAVPHGDFEHRRINSILIPYTFWGGYSHPFGDRDCSGISRVFSCPPQNSPGPWAGYCGKQKNRTD
nr:universal stress protein [candidate division Zixibacteria bacterium]